jgi:alcohol dehydrogenase class IV
MGSKKGVLMTFEFMTATRILFGVGKLNEIGKIAEEFGKRALIVVSNEKRAARLFELLKQNNIETTTFVTDGEPTIEQAKRGVETARGANCDVVISFGGGSVLDSGKAIAALATNQGDPLDYLEVIGRNQPLTTPPLPFIAIPTTAGTGSEVTRNAVLASPEHRVKVSLRSPMMLAKVALVDPELTYGLPPDVTASTGMDALTQLIEPFTSNAANPLTDALCREGMTRAARSLRRAYEDDHAAREDMALASLFGGLALANAKLGAVHGFAGPLGGMYPIPHGVACAALLPYVMAMNVRALKERQPDDEKLRRYDEVAKIITGNPDATAEDGVKWVRELREALNIPTLGKYGIKREDFPDIVEKSAKASSMKGNALTLTNEELTEILEQAV